MPPAHSWARCSAPGHPCGDDAELLVSEIFGNSVRHSGSGAAGETVTVAVRVGDSMVRVEVTDRAGPGRPELRPADGQAVAVLAALSAEPGATVAVIAARAGINTAAARQALLAHEKNGTATRVKGSRPGIADTWTPAALEAPRDEAPPAETLGAGSSPDAGRPSAEPADGTADVGQPAPVPADGTAEGGEAEVGTAPGPDSAVTAVTAEAAGTVAAIAQAAGEAGKALAAGNLDVALAALDTARDLAAQGRRAVKAAASGRRAPATRPGALRDLVEEHLRKFPGTAFTPHQVGKVLTRSAGAVANALDKLTALGVAQMVTDKPRTYRLAAAASASAPGAAGDLAASAEAAPSAA